MNGDSYEISTRFWAVAAFSRFVRPGAERVAAGSRDPDLRVSAFRNRDGSRVVQVLNTGQSPERIAMQGLGRATSYLVDATHDLEARRPGIASVPARSLVTYVVREG